MAGRRDPDHAPPAQEPRRLQGRRARLRARADRSRPDRHLRRRLPARTRFPSPRRRRSRRSAGGLRPGALGAFEPPLLDLHPAPVPDDRLPFPRRTGGAASGRLPDQLHGDRRDLAEGCDRGRRRLVGRHADRGPRPQLSSPAERLASGLHRGLVGSAGAAGRGQRLPRPAVPLGDGQLPDRPQTPAGRDAERAAGRTQVPGGHAPACLLGPRLDARTAGLLPAAALGKGRPRPALRPDPRADPGQPAQPGAGDRFLGGPVAGGGRLVAPPAGHPRLVLRRCRHLGDGDRSPPPRLPPGRRLQPHAEVQDRGRRRRVARPRLRPRRRPGGPGRAAARLGHPGPRCRRGGAWGVADGRLRGHLLLRLPLPFGLQRPAGGGGADCPPSRSRHARRPAPVAAAASSAGRTGSSPGCAGSMAGSLRGLLPALADGGQPGPDRAPRRPPLRDGGHLAAGLPVPCRRRSPGRRLAPDGGAEAGQRRPGDAHPGAGQPARRDAAPGAAGRAAAGAEPDLPAHLHFGGRRTAAAGDAHRRRPGAQPADAGPGRGPGSARLSRRHQGLALALLRAGRGCRRAPAAAAAPGAATGIGLGAAGGRGAAGPPADRRPGDALGRASRAGGELGDGARGPDRRSPGARRLLRRLLPVGEPPDGHPRPSRSPQPAAGLVGPSTAAAGAAGCALPGRGHAPGLRGRLLREPPLLLPGSARPGPLGRERA